MRETSKIWDIVILLEELLNGGNTSELLEVLTLLGYEELLP